jgi:protein CpxP
MAVFFYSNKESEMNQMTTKVRDSWIVFSLFVVFLLLGAAAPAFLQAEPNKDRRMGSHTQHDRAMHDFVGHSFMRLLRHAKDLGLSEEQVTKLKGQVAEYQKARIRGEADLKLAEVDVQALVHDDKADMTAIENAIKKSEAAHSALRLEGVKALRAAAAVLSPEQREKWRTSTAGRHGVGKGESDYQSKPEGTPKPK